MLMCRTYNTWFEYLPDNSPQVLTNFVCHLIGKACESEYEQRQRFVEEIFHAVSMNLNQKKDALEHANNLSTLQLIQYLNENIIPKEEIYRRRLLAKKEEREVQAHIINRLIDWLFIMGISDIGSACTKFSKMNEDILNNDNLKHLLDLLVEHDSANGFEAVYEHFADEQYYNEELWERIVFADYMENLYLLKAKDSLNELSQVSPRRSAYDSNAAIRFLLIMFCTLVENFYIDGLPDRFIEVALKRLAGMERNQDNIDLKGKLQTAIAMYDLHQTGNIDQYLRTIDGLYTVSYNKAINSLVANDVIQCFELYSKLFPFLTSEEYGLRLSQLETLLNKALKSNGEAFYKQLQLMVSAPESKLKRNPEITLFLPLMESVYFELSADEVSKKLIQPSLKVSTILLALSGEDEPSITSLIDEYLVANKERYSQSDVFNFYAVLSKHHKDAAIYLLTVYKKQVENVYELEVMIGLISSKCKE